MKKFFIDYLRRIDVKWGEMDTGIRNVNFECF